MLIYKITNKINGKIYVGKTEKSIEKRFKIHIKNALVGLRQSRLYSAIRKYGASNFSIEVIEVLEQKDCVIEKLNALEIKYIKDLDSKNPNVGYNMTDGGDGGTSEASREASSLFRKNKTFEELYGDRADDIKKKIGDGISEYYSKHERVNSQNARNKMSDTRKKMFVENSDYRNKLLLHIKSLPKRKVGEFHHSQETKNKLSNFRTGKTYEDLYSKEKALEIKKAIGDRWSGDKNPNHVDFPDLKQIEILQYIIDNPQKTMKQVRDFFGFSLYLMRQIFRKNGIEDIRLLRQKKDVGEILFKLIEGIKNGRNIGNQ
jgi:group I intron endonuclease